MNIITLKNIGKKFIVSSHTEDNRNIFSKVISREKKKEFWALRDINLEIEKGKIIGIVGRNGAGKTTLLNVIAGLCPPTEGEMSVGGKVFSFITLGAGFQDDLSGRENIFLNASLLGMSKGEINKKLRRIMEFSELNGFLDAPIKTYSQGMWMRLGFSIAVNMNFDILLIDEIIFVGDIAFQNKCFEKIMEFRRDGKTMFITTQHLKFIERLCDSAILLEEGIIKRYGEPETVVNCYRKLVNEKKFSKEISIEKENEVKWIGNKENWGKIMGTGEVAITSVEFLNKYGEAASKFKTAECLIVKVHFEVKEEVKEPHFGIAIFREDGVYCYGPNTSFDGYKIESIKKGKGWFSLEYKEFSLLSANYLISIAIWDKFEVVPYSYYEGYFPIEITGFNLEKQLFNLPCEFRECPNSKNNHYEQTRSRGNSQTAQIVSAVFVDEDNNPISLLKTGDEAKLLINYLVEIENKNKKHLLKIEIFRDDDISCHSVLKEVSGESGTFYLIYPEFNLLTGNYYISAKILPEGEKEPLVCKTKECIFRVSFSGQDHGTIYLPHKWRWELP